MNSYQVTIDIEGTFDVINKRLERIEEQQKSIVNILHILGDKIYVLESRKR